MFDLWTITFGGAGDGRFAAGLASRRSERAGLRRCVATPATRSARW